MMALRSRTVYGKDGKPQTRREYVPQDGARRGDRPQRPNGTAGGTFQRGPRPAGAGFAKKPVEVTFVPKDTGKTFGNKKKSSEDVMKRFRFHSLPDHYLNRHVKSIVNPRRVFTMIGCHEVARINGKAADSHGNPIKNNFRERTPQQDVIRINHYAVRSLEEFREKQLRGRASGTKTSVPMDYFNQYDLNDIEEKQ